MIHFVPTICLSFLVVATVIGCAEAPTVPRDPSWITQPTRTVDNGFIVYVGKSNDINPERAQFKAEGQALEDLANECSMIPKGARIEDRYLIQPKHESFAYVKVAVELQICEEAKQANDPQSIRRLASQTFTEQLKRYQDLAENDEFASFQAALNAPIHDGDENTLLLPSTVEASNSSLSSDSSASIYQHFAIRQYFVYQKEVVILAQPSAFAPNSPESVRLTTALTTTSRQISQLTTSQSKLKTTPLTWSSLPRRPIVIQPRPITSSAPTPTVTPGPIRAPKTGFTNRPKSGLIAPFKTRSTGRSFRSGKYSPPKPAQKHRPVPREN